METSQHFFQFMLKAQNDLAQSARVKRYSVNKDTLGTSRLNPAEVEAVQLFAQFAYALGQRRSVGEIYGLLFFSHLPLPFNDLKERLQLSSGSTSQGLTWLRELGAVREVELPEQRRTHYEAVAELRNLAGNFLRRQVATQFGDSGPRLDLIAEHAQALTGPARTHALARVKLLENWTSNAKRITPLLLRLLGSRNGK
jgi:DNA-binding transcriptional regulator GbsR (MarR family)